MPPHMPTPPVFFLLFYLLLLVTLTLIYPADSKCKRSFQCGKLGLLEFPFAELGNTECGLLFANCTSTPPTIQLGPEGYGLHVLNRTSANKLRVEDPHLEYMLKPQGICHLPVLGSLNNTASSKLQPLSSFVTYHNITLLSCPKAFKPVDCKCYDGCDAFNLCYRHRSGTPGPLTEGSNDIPDNCSIVHMPFKEYPSPSSDGRDLLQHLTPVYELQWQVSAACKFCEQGGDKCPHNTTINRVYCQGNRGWKHVTLVAVICAGAAFLGLCFVVSFLICRRKNKSKGETQNVIDLFLKNNGNLATRRYKYVDIKKMTKSFSQKLGSGGYGCVYKGTLLDGGHSVAVKVLNKVTENGEEFLNEVASISRTSHVNIVTLVGYCIEGCKRALIYEFMPNGSLDKFIQHRVASPVAKLGWDKLFNIAVGTARGLEYLHQGCNTRILHFDIKPHNILLDKDFNPKISDFGLAKLCPNRSSLVSMLVARGTIGYIAPEVFCRNFGRASHKSDVYSYGMLILEMVVGRQNLDNQVGRSSEMYFPEWIFNRLEANSGIGFVDTITNEDEWKLARKMIVVGLWCIQTQPRGRPSISKVIEMLGGNMDCLEIPPMPYLASPPRPVPDTPPTFETSTVRSDGIELIGFMGT